MAIIQLVLGTFGILGYYIGIHDKYLFLLYMSLFVFCTYNMTRTHKVISIFHNIHRYLGLTVRGGHHIYVGNLSIQNTIDNLNILLGDTNRQYKYEVYESINTGNGKLYRFAVLDVVKTDNINRCIITMRNNLKKIDHPQDIIIRQYIARNNRIHTYNTQYLGNNFKKIFKIRQPRNICLLNKSQVSTV